VVITTELEPMVEDGAGLVVGTVGPDNTPRVTRAWSVNFVASDRIRIAVTADDPLVVANLHDGRIALTAADVRTFHSVQLKGNVVLVEPPGDHDLDMVRIQTDRFLVAVHETDGNALEVLRRILPHDIVMVEVEVAESFDQTPGPGAGAPLRRSDAP
jgi:hypothetical protein